MTHHLVYVQALRPKGETYMNCIYTPQRLNVVHIVVLGEFCLQAILYKDILGILH
jgi:hypothetical protein